MKFDPQWQLNLSGDKPQTQPTVESDSESEIADRDSISSGNRSRGVKLIMDGTVEKTHAQDRFLLEDQASQDTDFTLRYVYDDLCWFWASQADVLPGI